MNRAHIFPAILVLLYIGAAAVYASQGDWRRMTYWIAAEVINISVTV